VEYCVEKPKQLSKLFIDYLFCQNLLWIHMIM